ncbi:MAG: hypothetical protein ACM3WP_25765 [Acidobacteriota bacterium]
MSETFCTLDWEKLVRVLAALLTPVIAVVTTYIAYQQYQTNRRQHRLALFEKRMAVFNSTMEFISSVLQLATVDAGQLFALLRETRDHEFLFGPEVKAFIDDVYSKGVELQARDKIGGEQPRFIDLMTWFAAQPPLAREKFRKYLDFRTT